MSLEDALRAYLEAELKAERITKDWLHKTTGASRSTINLFLKPNPKKPRTLSMDHLARYAAERFDDPTELLGALQRMFYKLENRAETGIDGPDPILPGRDVSAELRRRGRPKKAALPSTAEPRGSSPRPSSPSSHPSKT